MCQYCVRARETKADIMRHCSARFFTLQYFHKWAPSNETEAEINKAVALWKEKKHRRKLPRSSCLQQNERATPNAREEQEVEEGGGFAGSTQVGEIQELPSSNQGELNCLAHSTLGQEEEAEQLAKELDLTFSSEDSAFESDMDDLL